MNRAKRLKPVQRMAARDEEHAIVQLGERVDHLDKSNRRLEELQLWRQEYTARMKRDSIKLNDLQGYRLFMHQLGDAIEQQQAVVVRAREQEVAARKHWQSKYARRAALDRIIERFLKEEREAFERREQMQLDEFNAIKNN